MAYSILIAVQDAEERSQIADVLSEVGYRVIVSTGFKHARQLLKATTPATLVADLRMGIYNGLQLVTDGRSGRARLSGVILTDGEDGGLAETARQLGADLLTRPVEPVAMLGAVSRALSSVDVRRHARRRIHPGITCEVDGRLGWIVDASEGGLRIDLPDPVNTSLPASLQVSLPTLQFSLPAQMAWVAPTSSMLRCGVILPAEESPEAAGWRGVVRVLPTGP